jgi:ABC-type Na+ transport system ATPase subunit NatA
VHSPANLLLDEPTNGLDVMATRAVRELIRHFRDEGHCIVFSSHIMQEVSALCDEVAIVAGGRIVAAGHAGSAGRTIRRRLAGGSVRACDRQRGGTGMNLFQHRLDRIRQGSAGQRA